MPSPRPVSVLPSPPAHFPHASQGDSSKSISSSDQLFDGSHSQGVSRMPAVFHLLQCPGLLPHGACCPRTSPGADLPPHSPSIVQLQAHSHSCGGGGEMLLTHLHGLDKPLQPHPSGDAPQLATACFFPAPDPECQEAWASSLHSQPPSTMPSTL